MRLAAGHGSREEIASDAGQCTEFDVQIESLYDDTVSRYRQTIQILSAAVTVILLIACINISGLLLARGATRQSELAIRTAIGAGRLRVLRQLLTESLVLSLAGGFFGAGLAWLLLDLLLGILPLHLPANAPPSINIQVLIFAVATSVVTAVLFGLVPAIRLSHVHLGTRLAQASRRMGPALSRRGGQLLIAAEVTLAIVLLTGAGLLVQSFGKALAIDIGFEPDSYLTMEVFTIDPSPQRSVTISHACWNRSARFPACRQRVPERLCRSATADRTRRHAPAVSPSRCR